MSYILEALKKSEQERRRGEVPEITHFETTEDNKSGAFKLWPVVVVVLLIVNIGGLVMWAPWQDKAVTNQTASDTSSQVQAKQAPVVSMPAPTPSKQVKPVIVKPKPSPIQPVANQAAADPKSVLNPVAAPQRITPEAAPKVRAEKTNAPTVVKQAEPELITPSTPPPAKQTANESSRTRPVTTSYLPQLQELPASMQDRIPDMSFSSHMYSSQARFRSIIINGRRLKEGQFLNDEIQVREITEKGVILGLDETLFEVDVLGQWVN